MIFLYLAGGLTVDIVVDITATDSDTTIGTDYEGNKCLCNLTKYVTTNEILPFLDEVDMCFLLRISSLSH